VTTPAPWSGTPAAQSRVTVSTPPYPAVAAPSAKPGTIAVALSTSQPVMASLATPETLVINNAGRARADVTVHLSFQSIGPGQHTYHGGNLLSFSPITFEVQRLDQGTWHTLPMADNDTEPDVYGSFVTSVPAGVSTQHLRINAQIPVPAADAVLPVTVRLTSSRAQLVKHSAVFQVSDLLIRKTAGPGTVRRDTSTEFDFTVTNPSTLTYPDIYLSVNASCGAGGGVCVIGSYSARGIDVDWYDHGTWKPEVVNGSTPLPYDGGVIRSGPFGPGVTVVRLRLSLGTSLPRDADFSQLSLSAYLPMPAGAQGIAPELATRGALIRITQ
jgi:hypothetical protein